MTPLARRAEARLGEAVRAATRLSGGMMGEVWRLELESGRAVVAKRSANDLRVEAMMLRYLAERGALPVPEVLWAEADLLLLAFAPGSSRFDADAERHAAECLAALHARSWRAFGFPDDTLLGRLRQPNPPTARWVAFFREARLGYLMGVLGARLPDALRRRLTRLLHDLDGLLLEPPQPALLHGDVWASNVLAERGRITAFLDPALAYGHPELELAYVALFGTFGAAFFRRYQELAPLEPGFFERRRHVYALYPLLAHLHFFGEAYAPMLEESLTRAGY